MRKTKKLRELINSPGIIIAPGAADALTARIIQEAGFSVVYATGAGIANSMLGVPDIGLTTMTEVLWQAKNIANSVDVPVIADADTGYGNPINAMRTIREYEQAGIAGLHIEDQIFPKKCGHFVGKAVVPKEEMIKKIQAALEARTDPDFVIIARTDARSVNGLDDAINRGKAYESAGADMLFIEAPESVEELKIIGSSFKVPVVANMVEGGKTPLLDATELEKLGFKLVLFANAALRASALAVKNIMKILKEEGTTKNALNLMIDFKERQRIVGLDKIQELEKRLLVY